MKGYSAFDGIGDERDHVPLTHDDQQPVGKSTYALGGRLDDIDGDDGLVDWQHINRLRRHTVFGLNVAPIVDVITLRAPPGMPESVARKRRAICLASAFAALVGIAFIAVLASRAGPANNHSAAKSGSSTSSTSSSASDASQPQPHQGEDHHHMELHDDVDWSKHEAGPLCTWQSLYLPNIVVPDVYNLKLEIPMEPPFVVHGHADVALNVTNGTNCIVLHSVDIDLTSLAIKDGDRAISGRVYGGNSTLQQVALQFTEELQPSSGRYVLHLHFLYKLQDGVDGLYLSKYHDGSGQTQAMVVSQFESVAARKAFPCFDEPRFKVRWGVSLQTPPAPVTALSNMPEAGSVPGDEQGSVLHQFQETPYMSPYLLGIVVGDLAGQQYKCEAMSGVLPVVAWGTLDRKPQLGSAPKVACLALKQLEALTGVPYPLPKLDLVAVPEFAAGAMENWGLIMYNEVDILVEIGVDDLQQKYDVAATIAHEVTHQWFGNLVTCSSWSELWLNEGFATYFENTVANAVIPGYRYFDFFYPEVTAKALNDDAMAASHPLSVLAPLASVGAVDNLFDSVEYEKGAAVLRMLHAFLARDTMDPDNSTTDNFMGGLRLYLQQHQYSTATYQDLWSSIGAVAGGGGKVAELMRTWTLRKNYPVVGVQVSPSGVVVLSQDPFSTQPQADADAADPSQPPANCTDAAALGTWWVPFSYRFQGERVTQWAPFSSCHARLHRKLPQGKYILVNPRRYGFYRVNYQKNNWEALAQAAGSLPGNDPGYIPDIDLAGLLDDSFRLSEAGRLPITHFLDLVAALPRRLQPDAYASWALAKQGLDKITLLLRTAAGSVPAADCADELLSWLHNNVTGPYIANLQLPGENQGLTFQVFGTDPVQIRRLRPLLLAAAAEYGNAALVHDAAQLLADADQGGQGVEDLNPDVRSAIYRAALAGGSVEVYEVLLKMYRQTTSAKDKRRLLNALATTPAPALIRRTLALAVSPEVRLSDMGALLKHIGTEGGPAVNLTWEFILTNSSQILDRYPGGGSGVEAAYSFGRAAKSLASLFVDEAALPRVEAWADKHQYILDPRFKEILRENLSQNRRWLETQGQGVCAWLAGQLKK